jgi:hypothetical protein
VFDADVISHDGDASKCTIAEIQGPVAHTPEEQQFQRCITQPTKTCSSDADCPPWTCGMDATLGANACPNTGQPCATSADCLKTATGTIAANKGTCAYILGAPLAYPPTALSNSSCVLIVFEKPDGSPGFHGTIDLSTGTVNLDTFSILAFTDSSGTCNICTGDDVPLDGTKHGTCIANATTLNGVALNPAPAQHSACDINGVNSAIPGSTSFDCSYKQAFLDLAVNMAPSSTDGMRWTLDSNRPVGSDGVTRTWCGTCKNAGGSDTWKTCQSSADCNGGTCVGTTPDNAALPPNACANGICNFDPVTGGTCTQAGSGAQPTIFCLPGQNDLVATNPGNSTTLDPDNFNVKMAGLSCLDATRALSPSNPLLIAEDATIGLPGPLVTQIVMQVQKIYSNGSNGSGQ